MSTRLEYKIEKNEVSFLYFKRNYGNMEKFFSITFKFWSKRKPCKNLTSLSPNIYRDQVHIFAIYLHRSLKCFCFLLNFSDCGNKFIHWAEYSFRRILSTIVINNNNRKSIADQTRRSVEYICWELPQAKHQGHETNCSYHLFPNTVI